MEYILDEIRATFDCGIWYPVISATLMLPDACGAVENWGLPKHPRDRYKEWYDKWVYLSFNSRNVRFDGEVIYIVRNALIHEITGFTSGKHGFDRIMFMPPNKQSNTFDFNLSATTDALTVLQVSVESMMEAVHQGVRAWLIEVRADSDKRREQAIERLLQIRPNGEYPYFVGMPVIS